MIKKQKRKKKMHNQGNTFIMVVATLSFLAVLVAAMLVAVALCYRLKAYDINARDNFYYLEQAMDEIYAGVGADAMKHLNTAYDDTVEVLVYYDARDRAYVTMNDQEANNILKNTYMHLIQSDSNYTNSVAVATHLNSFISNPYDATSKTDGVLLSVGNISTTTDTLTIHNVILKREAEYSTINTRKNADGTAPAGDTFVQTITTDLVIGKPEFDVRFNTIDSDLSDLYEFIMVADRGVEINNATTSVNITGNIYAASDFYNKDYDTPVSSYADDENDGRYIACNGKNEKSMYSGIYINGADVILSSDRVIVPGTIAAFNSANLLISGSSQTEYSLADIWADGIVLGGYSLLKTVKAENDPEDAVQGASVNMRANAYIYDDLELNAKASEYKLVGKYFGYNYASTDNRTYVDTCVTENGGRVYAGSVEDEAIKDGATIDGQAHYNSSSIIINGEDSSLDLSNVSDMYIAGQAYIETSKVTKKHDKATDADGNETADAYTVKNKNGQNEAVKYSTFDYPDMIPATANKPADNYTIDSNTVESNKNKSDADKSAGTNIQDYRTGEAISIKSNQLAYIPTKYIVDNEDGLYVELPVELYNSIELMKDTWTDAEITVNDLNEEIAKIPVIKTVISGKKYYFFDFSSKTGDNRSDVMNTFIEQYAALFTPDENGVVAADSLSLGMTDITDYEYFKVKMLSVNTNYSEDDAKTPTYENGQFVGKANGEVAGTIYSNSAITVKNGNTFTIKAKSSAIEPLIAAQTILNNNVAEQTGSAAAAVNINAGNAVTAAASISTQLQRQYKEVKWTLSATSRDAEAVNDAHDMSESEITPINYFFNFNKIEDKVVKLNSGYKVWIDDGDVEIDATGFDGGNVKGLVICKGDVTFKDNVESFEGLIVSGSKIIINDSMIMMSNAEVVKTILRECDESQQYTDASKNHFAVCELFQQYQPIYKDNSSSSDVETEKTKSISAVQFEDVLSFNNWKKNVD